MKGEWMSYEEMCKAENVTVIPYEPPKEKDKPLYEFPNHFNPIDKDGNFRKLKYVDPDPNNR